MSQRAWTEEHANEAFRHNVEGGLKGAAVATAILTPAFFLLQRRSANFRAIPIPLKAFGVVTVAVPCISIGAEKAGERYERGILGVSQLEATERDREEKRWEGLSTGEKIRDWGKRYQWSIVGGSWLGTMAIAGIVIGRSPYMSFSQKLVQTRVVAQASTLGTLIASGMLAGMGSQGEKPKKAEDHSWRDILEQEAKQEEEDKRRAKEEEKEEKADEKIQSKITGTR
ncbi:putative mitochondrion protein [Filobasidium floriforme]|uniref:putative mitochondrion protein n=1 Tax=Filobasidium floriforme TaxID=5210 RepID=UPI001E8CCFF1|nr:putative mitochondrion protein [Filobasidium floriforme]KAH8079037.1 putative mitochondrion protein [Filobasidium floriforme]